MKISKIIEGALKQLGVLAAGENAQAGELADAVDCLHQLLAQWATDQFYVYKSNLLVLKLDGSGIYRIMPKQHRNGPAWMPGQGEIEPWKASFDGFVEHRKPARHNSYSILAAQCSGHLSVYSPPWCPQAASRTTTNTAALQP